MTREEALALLKKYNKEPFHLQHAFTVEGVMRWYANELGHGDEADFWALVGLLHDVDFEQWPEQHCKKAPELLAEIGADDAFVHAVCSHGYGLCSDVEPVLEMEKVLFAADELTGLVGAAALMRPSKSVQDMELSSLKKKFKDKKFAAGCSREVIRQGAEMLGWPLEELIPACRKYYEKTGRRISFEYAMIKNVNDTKAHGEQLIRLLRGLPCHVNLIPLNHVDESPLEPSLRRDVQAFQQQLEASGITATVRRTLGGDIDASCGQLRRKYNREKDPLPGEGGRAKP